MKQKMIVVLVMGAALACGVARADWVSYTYVLAEQPMDFATNFNVTQFNSSLGTLTGIEFRLSSSLVADLGIENTTLGSSNYVTAILPSDWELRRQSDSLFLAASSPTVGVYSVGLAPFDGSLDYQPPSGQTFLALTNTMATVYAYTEGSLLTAFTGGGTVGLALDATLGALNVVGETGKDAEGISNNEAGFASLEVYYWYNAIPEPSTWALGALGTLALALRRRRRLRGDDPTAGH